MTDRRTAPVCSSSANPRLMATKVIHNIVNATQDHICSGPNEDFDTSQQGFPNLFCQVKNIPILTTHKHIG